MDTSPSAARLDKFVKSDAAWRAQLAPEHQDRSHVMRRIERRAPASAAWP